MRRPPAGRPAAVQASAGWSGVPWWQRLLGALLMATALAVALFRAPDRAVQTLWWRAGRRRLRTLWT